MEKKTELIDNFLKKGFKLDCVVPKSIILGFFSLTKGEEQKVGTLSGTV